MRSVKDGWRRLRTMTRLGSIEQGLDEEIRFHIDRQTEKNIRLGMTPDEARRAATARFGGIEMTKDRTRDEFRPARFENALRDVRYGCRALRRTAGFTTVSILTLALGIGATTTVFSVINGVLLKPLPYAEPESLVAVMHTAPGLKLPPTARGVIRASLTQYFTYLDRNRTFESMGVFASGIVTVTGDGEPEQVKILGVTEGTLRTLRASPMLGRTFTPHDDAPGSPRTAILTYGYWQRRYGGDRSVVGRNITLDGEPRQIVGVMPRDFQFLDTGAEMFYPLQINRSELTLGMFTFDFVARLKPGVTLEQANGDVARMIPEWLRAWPAPRGINAQIFESARITAALRPLKDEVVGDVGQLLWILMATIGIVLLIACANVVNLLLIRAEGRHQELAIRAALGAGWGRIARELLMEHLVLASIGGAAGLALAYAALPVLLNAAPAGLPRIGEIDIDVTVLWFVLGISVLAGLVFGCVPVFRITGLSVASALRGGGRTASQSREHHRARNTLVVVQVALALVLLVGSGLMVRTFHALRSIHPGFTDPERVQLLRVRVPYPDPERVIRVHQGILDALAAIPGVTSAAFTNSAPMEPFGRGDGLFLEGQRLGEREIPPIRTYKFISPGYFQAIGTPLIAGRDLTWTDLYERRPVAVISANLAREIWGDDPAAALGKRVREMTTNPWREIVGVVGDVYDSGAHMAPPAVVYWPALMGNFYREGQFAQRAVTYVVRSNRTGTDGFVPDLSKAVWSVDGNLPLADVRTLGDVYGLSMARTSFALLMLAIAGSSALALGVVGIFGVISYTVAQRTREIGIRATLGARPGELQRMFVRQGLTITAIGITCGLAAAVLLTRFMRALLFAIDPLDPATYAAAAALLIAAAAFASFVPAQRATAVDPARILGSD
jgi:putative ABC transport system permease protein